MKTGTILLTLFCLAVTITVHAVTIGSQFSFKNQSVPVEADSNFLLTGMIDSVEIGTYFDPADPCEQIEVTTITFSESVAAGMEMSHSIQAKLNTMLFIHDTKVAVQEYAILAASPTTVVIRGVLDPMEVDPATCTYTSCEVGSTSFGLIAQEHDKS